MIVNVNNNQYKSSRFGLVKLKNITANVLNIITGKVICFKCENEVIYNSASTNWLALIKPIGKIKDSKRLSLKFKRRKNYKRIINTRQQDILAQTTKLMLYTASN
ncbi:50S ribosomal protein L21 [Candidatus Hodgkinia cicadicola]|nr:50S ribosomal protein L21 [Candidatus Hodgkinia cicadicola]